MAFAVLILTSRNLLVILNIYLYLSSLSRDASHAAPASLGYRTLYASQLMSNLHNPRHKPLSSNLTLIRGIHIAMNFSISLTLISLSNDISTNPGPVRNFSIPKLNVCGLKISHLNTRSILPKIDSHRLLVKDNLFDVFAGSETWLKPSISDSEVAIPGYSIVRMDCHGKICGGTAIYICDGLPFNSLTTVGFRNRLRLNFDLLIYD